MFHCVYVQGMTSAQSNAVLPTTPCLLFCNNNVLYQSPVCMSSVLPCNVPYHLATCVERLTEGTSAVHSPRTVPGTSNVVRTHGLLVMLLNKSLTTLLSSPSSSLACYPLLYLTLLLALFSSLAC